MSTLCPHYGIIVVQRVIQPYLLHEDGRVVALIIL